MSRDGLPFANRCTTQVRPRLKRIGGRPTKKTAQQQQPANSHRPADPPQNSTNQ